jgi:tetratricopeptide (TPR) repeat protein
VVKEDLDRLYYKAQSKPQKAIPELLKLKKKYPHVPQIYNYLAAAYSRAGEQEKATAITQENIRKNPKYLFARINQAQIFIENKEYEKIPELFQNKYDLKMLYPKRKKFHISEVANFMGIMGLYFAKTNQRDIAEKYHEILQEIAPSYPIAKMLKRELHPDIVSRAIKKFLEAND